MELFGFIYDYCDIDKKTQHRVVCQIKFYCEELSVFWLSQKELEFYIGFFFQAFNTCMY